MRREAQREATSRTKVQRGTPREGRSEAASQTNAKRPPRSDTTLRDYVQRRGTIFFCFPDDVGGLGFPLILGVEL